VYSKLSLTDFEAIQEMEAVCKILHHYVTLDAQTDNFQSNSLKPMYRKVCLASCFLDSYEVMSFERPPRDALIETWKRHTRKVSEFTEFGKKCLTRLRHQVHQRLPPPSAKKSIAVLLDPMTKLFASSMLDEEGNLYQDTLNYLKEQHRVAYWAVNKSELEDLRIQNSGNGDNNKTPSDEDVGEAGCARGLVVVNFCSDIGPAKEQTLEEKENDLDSQADKIVEDWLAETIKYHKFLHVGHSLDIRNNKVDLISLIGTFDTMKYFREEGTLKYPTIAMLARIHFSRMDNSGFQERVFSTADNAMSSKQGSMSFEHLEMRTLLSHNKELIRKGVI